MKVLFVCDSLGSGGAQKLLVDLAHTLNGQIECEFAILNSSNDRYSQKLIKEGASVYFLSNELKDCRNVFKKLADIIKDGHYDLVHAHLFPATYYVSNIKRVLRKKCPPIVMTEHNTDNRRRHIKYLRPLEKWIYEAYDHIISISDGTQEALVKWINPSDLHKYSVIENGVPLSDFYNADPYRREQLISGIEDNSVILCMVGSLTEQKNHMFMLEVMEKLPDKYHLVCVGEGPLKSNIWDSVVEKKLEDRAHLLGFRNDVASIMKACDIGVIPSIWEGFGLVAVEEMACGLPVVCSDVAGLSDVVGDAGIKCKVNDVDSFVQGITTVKKAFDLSVVRHQANRFDINKMASSYLEIYFQVKGKSQ